MTKAQLTFDGSALDKIFTSDYIEMSPVGEFDPRAKVPGSYTAEKKPGVTTIPGLDVSDTSIRNYGTFAIVITKPTYNASADTKAYRPDAT